MALLSAIIGAGFTVAVCVALGSILVRCLRLEFCRLEATLFEFIGGSACLSLAVFLLCVIHQARLPVFLVGGAGAIGWALRAARAAPRRKALPAIPRGWLILFTVVYVAFFVCYLVNAAAPEISPDGSGYHLGNVARDWRTGGFDWGYHSIYSSFGQGIEMLFLVAYAIGRNSASALVHMTFQAVLPLLMLCYGRRFGFPAVGAFAGLLVYACPVAGIAGASAYNDLAVATLVFAGFYCIEVNYPILSFNQLLFCGLLSGFSYAVKYTAGLALPLAAALTRGRRWLALLAGASVMAGPWIVRNWIWLRNPVAPFLNSWFPNPYWTAGAEHEYLAGLRHYPSFKSYWDFCSQLTVLGGLVPGMIGPAFLLLPLALLALRNPHGRKLLAAGAIYSIPAFLNIEVRFLVPALPFFALAMGLAMANSPGILPAVTLFQAFLCWPQVMSSYCDPNAWRIRDIPILGALRSESESQFIARHVGDYALKDAIASAVPAGSRIFSFAGRAQAYIDRDIVVGYESSQGLRIQEALEQAAEAHSGRRQAALIAKSGGCGFLLVNDADAVAQDLNQNMSKWGVSKVAETNGTTIYRLE